MASKGKGARAVRFFKMTMTKDRALGRGDEVGDPSGGAGG
jgi:hypothetical protein